MRRLRLELLTRLVEVDLLLPKSQRLSICERHLLHAKCGRIEGDRCVDVGYGEYKVIQVIDNEMHTYYDALSSQEEAAVSSFEAARRPRVTQRDYALLLFLYNSPGGDSNRSPGLSI
jgi:hypothetical protein